jgi:hypothetical protein
MYGLAWCLPSVGQPQGLPVPHEIPKTQKYLTKDEANFASSLRCLATSSLCPIHSPLSPQLALFGTTFHRPGSHLGRMVRVVNSLEFRVQSESQRIFL